MIKNWLEHKEKNDTTHVFKLVEISEKGAPDDALIKLLQ